MKEPKQISGKTKKAQPIPNAYDRKRSSQADAAYKRSRAVDLSFFFFILGFILGMFFGAAGVLVFS